MLTSTSISSPALAVIALFWLLNSTNEKSISPLAEGVETVVVTVVGVGAVDVKKLREAGRIDDAFRVTEDPVYRDKLIAEFGLA